MKSTQEITTSIAGKPMTSTRPTATQALLACGAIAGPLFILVVVFQIFTRTGFDIERHPISLLSLGDMGWIQIVNFVVSGLLVLAFTAGMRRVVQSGRGHTGGPLLVGVYGVGLIIAGIFGADPSLGFPPGTPEGIPMTLSLNAILHGVGFLLAFGSVILACLVFAFRDTGLRKPGWASYSAGTAIIALAFIAWPGQESASVRYFVAAVIVWVWITAMAVRLMNDY